ncbi:hypothetical protein DLAC_07936 [Tieghemostelium lacteum]|uniref:Vps72/YL1 C-terminal domain-containing protein n=1 Tax=Tieghemostelium lacteum TaxID=361077 RepID=A0A151ZAS2_TIELA|nr:hypothetical protein DLAC_07936 [Tieghemostelium lacteum]|eukprot:KYQ91035.1 hypothetical protein DLAC_07936 [Tieghemostelium lacteum]
MKAGTRTRRSTALTAKEYIQEEIVIDDGNEDENEKDEVNDIDEEEDDSQDSDQDRPKKKFKAFTNQQLKSIPKKQPSKKNNKTTNIDSDEKDASSGNKRKRKDSPSSPTSEPTSPTITTRRTLKTNNNNNKTTNLDSIKTKTQTTKNTPSKTPPLPLATKLNSSNGKISPNNSTPSNSNSSSSVTSPLLSSTSSPLSNTTVVPPKPTLSPILPTTSILKKPMIQIDLKLQTKLIEETKLTEILNRESLSQRIEKQEELDRLSMIKKKLNRITGPRIIFSSNSNSTCITFSEPIQQQQLLQISEYFQVASDEFKRSSPLSTQQHCIITGEKAKYIDPKSKLPFASLEAYRQLREKDKDKQQLQSPPDLSLRDSSVINTNSDNNNNNNYSIESKKKYINTIHGSLNLSTSKNNLISKKKKSIPNISTSYLLNK